MATPLPTSGSQPSGSTSSGQHGLGGFFHNLTTGVPHDLQGLGTGLLKVGGDMFHDATHNGWRGAALGALELGTIAASGLIPGGEFLVPLALPAEASLFGHLDKSHHYRSADDSRAMLHGFIDKGTLTGDLGRGRFSAAAHDAYNDPFGAFLTAGGLLGGATGMLGVGGEGVARLASAESRLGRLGQRAAGLERATAGVSPEEMVRLRGVRSADGVPLVAKRAMYKSGAGQSVEAKILARNPYKRARQTAMVALRNEIPGESPLGMFSGDRAYGNAVAKPKLQADRRELALANRLNSKDALTLRRKPVEAAASFYRNEGFRTERMLRDRAKWLRRQLDDPTISKKLDDTDKARIEAEAQIMTHPKVIEAVTNPTKRMLKFENSARGVEGLSADRLAAEGVDVEARRAMPLAMVYGPDRAKEMIDAMAEHERPIVHSHAPEREQSTELAMRKQIAVGGGAGSELANEEKANTGFAMRAALYNKDPLRILRGHENIVRAGARRQRLMDVLEHLQPVENYGDIKAKNLRVVHTSSDVRRHLQEAATHLGNLSAIMDEVPSLRAVHDRLANAEKHFLSGKVMAIPAHMYHTLRTDARTTAKGTGIVRKALAAWKIGELQLAPRWLVNNGVSQLALLAVAHPGSFIPALAENLLTRGKLAGHDLKEAAPEIFGSEGSGYNAAQQRAIDASGIAPAPAMHEVGAPRTVTGHIARLVNLGISVPRNISKLNTYISDDIPRLAALRIRVEHYADAYTKEMKARGVHVPKEDAVASVLADPQISYEVARGVAGDLIDFHGMTDVEREKITMLVPFWAWLSRMSMRTGDLAVNDPLKLLAMQHLGQLGLQDAQQVFGNVPDYVGADVPVGSPKDGVETVLKTYGPNPFSTPADVINEAESFFEPGAQTGGNNPMAQINPFVQAFLSGVENRDQFTGNDMYSKYRPGTGAFGDNPETSFNRMVHSFVYGLPQTRVLQGFENEAKYKQAPYAALYTPSGMDSLASYMGLPIGHLNIANAQAKYQKALAQLAQQEAVDARG